MDDRARRQLAAPQPYAVRISDPGEVAAALPSLLGFRPEESVVLVSLTGPGGGQVGLTLRADIPPPGHAAALAAGLTRSICSAGPRAVLLTVVSEAADERVPGEDLPHRGLVSELVRALAAADVPVREVLLVRAGRWWSYDCPHACCAPRAGTLLPVGVPELEVATVAAGMVVARDRDELEARIAPTDGVARVAMADAVLRAAADRAVAVLERGRDAVAREDRIRIETAASSCRPGPEGARRRLADDDVARLLWALSDDRVRDRALDLALGPDPAAAEALWTECTRRAPSPLDAAPATLLAVSAWLRGDGAMANVALERALDSDPDYNLARLLRQALAACLDPAELRDLLSATLDEGDADVDADVPPGC